MANLSYSESIFIASSPQAVYDLVSDVTRTGEWSPVCTGCQWDEGQTARVGAWFTGHNELPSRTWETRSQVVAADPGREFAWEVNGGLVRWGYTLTPADGGTELTEHWEFLPAGIATFRERYGPGGEAQIADRADQAHTGIPVTLAA
ncbi:MAG TPA: SRPBCC family protein, partial [Streptosporangiaceae bacterium]|nr:SRPBCC family protein [Streptosporangiaceae bacterium]